MLREAEKHAAVFPDMEWIYCRQSPIEVQNKQTSKGTIRVAMPLGAKRDSCSTFLEQMSAMRRDDE